MMKLGSTLALGLALVGFAFAAPAPSDAPASIVGKWEITKSSGDAPEGTLVEFTDKGEVKVVVKIENQELKIEGKYSLASEKLTLELKANDKDVKEELTIKKLTADDLELEDKDKKVDVLKKKK
jgi:uncharacterized protein (TIGR03066 family)